MITEIYKNSKVLLIQFIVEVCLFCTFANAQQLDSLKVKAAEGNLELKSLYKSFEAQLEQVHQAKAWQDPNLSFGYFISPIETRVGPQIARFSLTQMLPWFGTFKEKGNLASYQAEAEFEKFQDQKWKLYLQVAAYYYELAALRVSTTFELKQLDILYDLKSIVKVNYENNNAQLVDILRVDLKIEKQNTFLEVLKQQENALVAKLNQLMNRNLKKDIVIVHPQQILEEQILPITDSISSMHPRLEAIKKLQAANKAAGKLAIKQALPQFGLGLDYAIIQNRNVMNVDAGQDAIMPMLSVSLPIFGKKNTSRKKQVKLEGESLQFKLENEKNRLTTAINIAKYKQEELFRLLNLYDKQLLSLKDILELSEVSLANAETGIEEVLALYEECLLFQKQRVETLAKLKKTNEELMYLTLNSEL